jgi:flagellar L-ring protein precursor FlgH
MIRAAGVLAVLTLLLSGCGIVYPRVEIDDRAAAPMPAAAPAPATKGAIFQAAAYRPLFEDYRARLPGDTLTVQIVEKISASQKSTSSLDKSGSIDASIAALPGVKPNSFTTARATAKGSAENKFSGKGATESSNDFSGTITVVVRETLPNGHLVIAGEKQIGVNTNVDVLRFTGTVDPRSIQPGNVVQSAQIANVRLEQRGRGAQAEAQAIGWLGRVFLSLMPL